MPASSALMGAGGTNRSERGASARRPTSPRSNRKATMGSSSVPNR